MTRLRAVPVVDQLDRGEERVVLVVGRAVRVVGLAPAILDLTADGCDLADLLPALRDRYGSAPPGAEALVAAAVDDLVREGLIQVEGDESST